MKKTRLSKKLQLNSSEPLPVPTTRARTKNIKKQVLPDLPTLKKIPKLISTPKKHSSDDSDTASLRRTTETAPPCQIDFPTKIQAKCQQPLIQAAAPPSMAIPEAGPVSGIPYEHLVFSEKVGTEFKLKHLIDSYNGIKSALSMRDLTEQEIEKYKIELPTVNYTKKTLFLDLDETLIHSSLTSEVRYEHQIVVNWAGQTQVITFNLRPYCIDFLANISKIYEIYIFTASSDSYAREVMNFLNRKYPAITGYLSRESCLRTRCGWYIKDLRRIRNRRMEHMVLVDNFAYSFGKDVDNGIPILSFTSDSNDEELKYLQQYLIRCAEYEDIRQFNRQYLKLRGILNYHNFFSLHMLQIPQPLPSVK